MFGRAELNYNQTGVYCRNETLKASNLHVQYIEVVEVRYLIINKCLVFYLETPHTVVTLYVSIVAVVVVLSLGAIVLFIIR
jgi:hypothetical protein